MFTCCSTFWNWFEVSEQEDEDDKYTHAAFLLCKSNSAKMSWVVWESKIITQMFKKSFSIKQFRLLQMYED